MYVSTLVSLTLHWRMCPAVDGALNTRTPAAGLLGVVHQMAPPHQGQHPLH